MGQRITIKGTEYELEEPVLWNFVDQRGVDPRQEFVAVRKVERKRSEELLEKFKRVHSCYAADQYYKDWADYILARVREELGRE